MTLCFFFLSLWEIDTYKGGKMKLGTYPQPSLIFHNNPVVPK